MTGHLGFINIYSGGLLVFVQTSEKHTTWAPGRIFTHANVGDHQFGFFNVS
jgi:hypothetical protein